MCLIVDTNVFGSVFDPTAKEHQRFLPVYNWLAFGNGGKLIFGGTKYKQEVDFKTSRCLRLLAEFERRGRLLSLDDSLVDKAAAVVKKKVADRDFNDEHIVALVIVSRCCVVCTDDLRSISFLKRGELYPAGLKAPKIYGGVRNANLCCSDHVVGLCNDGASRPGHHGNATRKAAARRSQPKSPHRRTAGATRQIAGKN